MIRTLWLAILLSCAVGLAFVSAYSRQGGDFATCRITASTWLHAYVAEGLLRIGVVEATEPVHLVAFGDARKSPFISRVNVVRAGDGLTLGSWTHGTPTQLRRDGQRVHRIQWRGALPGPRAGFPAACDSYIRLPLATLCGLFAFFPVTAFTRSLIRSRPRASYASETRRRCDQPGDDIRRCVAKAGLSDCRRRQ